MELDIAALLNMAAPLIKDIATPPPSSKPFSMSISIPADHPKAEKIRQLAKTLATEQQLPSGILVKKLARPGAAEEFITALKDVGVDVDEVKERLRPVAGNPIFPPAEALVQLSRKYREQSKKTR